MDNLRQAHFWMQSRLLLPEGVVMKGRWSWATFQELLQDGLAGILEDVQFRPTNALEGQELLRRQTKVIR